MNASAPSRIRRINRYTKRAANIERRLDQLDRDFENANSMEAELRINEEIQRQKMYLLRIGRRIGLDARHNIKGRTDL